MDSSAEARRGMTENNERVWKNITGARGVAAASEVEATCVFALFDNSCAGSGL